MPPQIPASLKDLLFPKLCVGCKKSGTLLCDECQLKVQYIYAQVCPVCRGESIGGRTHPGCQTKWGIDGLISLAYYRGPVRNLIRQLKYHGATVTQELITQLIRTYSQHESLYLPPAIITSIPLFSTNQNHRGFNQADVIAQALSTSTHYPFVPDILKRSKNTPSQTKLTKLQRQQNMLGAFQINTSENIKNATFIVVDDVFTTGATLREAAKTLKHSGASNVYGFTVAQD